MLRRRRSCRDRVEGHARPPPAGGQLAVAAPIPRKLPRVPTRLPATESRAGRRAREARAAGWEVETQSDSLGMTRSEAESARHARKQPRSI